MGDTLQQRLDNAIAWHLQQLQKLCPPSTTATIVLRTTEGDVYVLGDDADTKAALFAAIRFLNTGKGERARDVKPVAAPRPIDELAPVVVDASGRVVEGGLDLDLNAGRIS